MICLSSAAVVRLARAKAEMDNLGGEFQKALKDMPQDTPEIHTKYLESRLRFIEAAEDLADEAIAMGHHTREGD